MNERAPTYPFIFSLFQANLVGYSRMNESLGRVDLKGDNNLTSLAMDWNPLPLPSFHSKSQKTLLESRPPVAGQAMIWSKSPLHRFVDACAPPISTHIIVALLGLSMAILYITARKEPVVSYRWTGWVWEITGWISSRLQEDYPSF